MKYPSSVPAFSTDSSMMMMDSSFNNTLNGGGGGNGTSRLNNTTVATMNPVRGGTVGNGSGVFVGQKISRIRWRPRSDTSTLSASHFITGSWDDQNANSISFWTHSPDFPGGEPQSLAQISHVGDVNALQFLSPELFVSGSSTGSIHLYRLLRESAVNHGSGWKIVNQANWDKIHHGAFGLSSSNAVSVNGDAIASVGQDGRIFLLNIKQKSPIRKIDQADSCSLTAVQFVKHDQIITANMRGQMKLWDLRSNDDNPVSTYFLSHTDQIGITCLDRHPTQAHVLCTGSQDGMLAIWDLRGGNNYPVTLLNAHQHPVSEVQFHRQQPDHIFSCSQNGDIWHWDASAVTRANLLHYGNQTANSSAIINNETSNSSPWLNSEAVKHKVESLALMSKQSLPINSLDASGSSLIFGGDNEAIYVFPSVIL